MLQATLAIVAGFIVLAWSADHFVRGAAAIARHLGVSPLTVGMTVVGFGTSAPELAISMLAALDGNTGLAVGNAIGSNIANIGLVLGMAALFVPLTVISTILRREYFIMLASMLLAFIVLADARLTFHEGMLLISALLGVMLWSVYVGVRESRDRSHAPEKDPLESEFVIKLELEQIISLRRAVLWLLAGGLLLLASSRLLVWGAVSVASTLGISDMIIGLTIVAIGTSLPEVAASVTSVLNGESDIAIGNVLGSNMFNSLGVIGLPAMIHPATLESSVVIRDLPFMLGISLLLYVLLYRSRILPLLTRAEGALLLMLYFCYLTLLGLQSA